MHYWRIAVGARSNALPEAIPDLVVVSGVYPEQNNAGREELRLGLSGELFVYGFLLLSNMVSFSSQIFLSALYVFILVTG